MRAFTLGAEIGNFATTGKAATINGGSTVHSYQHGLGMPRSFGNEYKKLSHPTLCKMQDGFKNLKLIFIDEYSMLNPAQLFYIDRRLREIKGKSNVHFGGVTVVLCGDPGQLPPVNQSYCLWEKNIKGIHDFGCILFQLFDSIIQLDTNMRVNNDDPDSVFFYNFLLRLRDGNVTEEDWLRI